jgi:hypothetical protein
MEKNDPSQEVRKGEELNLPKLTAFLQEKGLIDTDQLEVRQYPGGYSKSDLFTKNTSAGFCPPPTTHRHPGQKRARYEPGI